MAKKKEVQLKQYIVVSRKDGEAQNFCVFILQTCGLKARETFTKRYGTEYHILEVMQTACSEKTSAWLEENSPFYDGWREN